MAFVNASTDGIRKAALERLRQACPDWVRLDYSEGGLHARFNADDETRLAKVHLYDGILRVASYVEIRHPSGHVEVRKNRHGFTPDEVQALYVSGPKRAIDRLLEDDPLI